MVYFPKIQLQLSDKVKSLLLGFGETPENFTKRITFMSMFSDMHVKCQFLHAKKFGKRQWSLIGL